MKENVLPAVLAALALLAAAGCSTTKKTEELLSAASFNIVPASTPAQQERLKSLPADKVTLTKRNGWDYYVYPDPKQNVLYVGGDSEFRTYQQLRLQNRLAQEELDDSYMNEDWGAFPVW